MTYLCLLFSNLPPAITAFGLPRIHSDSAQWVGNSPWLTISFVPFRAVEHAHFLVYGHNLRRSDAFAEQPVSPRPDSADGWLGLAPLQRASGCT